MNTNSYISLSRDIIFILMQNLLSGSENNYSSTQTEHSSICPLLQKGKAVTYVPKDKFPDRRDLENYDIELVVDVFANDKDDDVHEKRYLMLRNKKTGQEERVMISDASVCLNETYELEWRENDVGEKVECKLGEPITTSLSVDCYDYFTLDEEQMWVEEFSDEQLDEIVEMEQYEVRDFRRVKAKDNEIREKIQKKNAKEICRLEEKEKISERREILLKDYDKIDLYDGVKKEKTSSDRSDLGSLDGRREAKYFQDDRKREKGSRKKKSILAQQYPVKIEYEEFNIQNMNRYSEISKFRVQPLLIQYLKIKENRHKKLPEIQRFLMTKNFYFEKSELSQVLSEICKSNKPKTSGWLLQDEYMSEMDKEQLKIELEQEETTRKYWRKKKQAKRTAEKSKDEE